MCSFDPVNLDELVEGAGGTRADLASIAILHIQRVIPNADSTVTLETFSYLKGVIVFLDTHLDPGSDIQFRDALRPSITSFDIHYLPPRSVTRSCRSFRCSFNDMQHLDPKAVFGKSDILKQWCMVEDLVQERLPEWWRITTTAICLCRELATISR